MKIIFQRKADDDKHGDLNNGLKNVGNVGIIFKCGQNCGNVGPLGTLNLS